MFSNKANRTMTDNSGSFNTPSACCGVVYFATIFTAVLTLLVPTLAWHIFLGRRRIWGIGTIVGIQILICLSVYTIGSGVCFDRRTGSPLCYFADTTDGRIWSRSPGFDPANGTPFRIYTREIKQAEDVRRQSEIKR